MHSAFQNLQGQHEYKHDNGEISIVTVELAGLGTKHVRVANLPPEIHDSVLRDTMSKHSDVKGIKEEQWSRIYRYSVSNGIRIVEVNLRTHVPSHVIIAGYRVLITYEGQPTTFYDYNEQSHQFIECPYRMSSNPSHTSTRAESWVDAVTRGTSGQQQEKGDSTPG